MKVKIVRLDKRAVMPTYAHKGDVCFDLYSIEARKLLPGKTELLGTGLAMQPEPGFELQIRPRSGLAAKHSITVLNSPATLEPTYTGEVKVVLHNAGNEPYQVAEGDRIAQALFKQFESAEFTEVGQLDNTARGDKGIGSTGR